MRKFYYYIEPCPHCGSPRTGRYAPSTLFGTSNRLALESLRHGELVRPTTQVRQKNLFCETCGHEWSGRVRAVLWKEEDIKADCERRGTLDLFARYQESHPAPPEEKRGFWMSLFPKVSRNVEPDVNWIPAEPKRRKIKKSGNTEIIYLDQDLLHTVLSD